MKTLFEQSFEVNQAEMRQKPISQSNDRMILLPRLRDAFRSSFWFKNFFVAMLAATWRSSRVSPPFLFGTRCFKFVLHTDKKVHFNS
jgi:hypothetical protein